MRVNVFNPISFITYYYLYICLNVNFNFFSQSKKCMQDAVQFC